MAAKTGALALIDCLALRDVFRSPCNGILQNSGGDPFMGRNTRLNRMPLFRIRHRDSGCDDGHGNHSRLQQHQGGPWEWLRKPDMAWTRRKKGRRPIRTPAPQGILSLTLTCLQNYART